MLQSIIVYSLLIGLMVLFGIIASIIAKDATINLEKENIRQLSFIRFETLVPLILFAFVFGMRYDVGKDYLQYLNIYNDGSDNEKIELFFRCLTGMFRELGFHYSLYFSAIAFIQVFFFFYAFKDERYLFPFLVFSLFTANEDWLFWMNGMRQATAMCIWLYSLKYITNRNFLKYLVWGIIACLFHRSAIILFIFYPLLRSGKVYFKSIPFQLILLCLAFGIRQAFSSLSPHISSAVNFYIALLGQDLYEDDYNTDQLLDTSIEQEGTGIAFLFRIVVNIIIIIYSMKLRKFYNSKHFNIIYFLYFFGLVTLYIFPAEFLLLTRPFRYFYFFQCIMIAYFLYYLYKTRFGIINMILYLALILLFLASFYITLYVSDENSHRLYQFFFQAK